MAYVESFEPTELKWCQPWLRVSLLIRVISDYPWDAETLPTAKSVLAKVLAMCGEVRQAGDREDNGDKG
jgi:hypothetical protein